MFKAEDDETIDHMFGRFQIIPNNLGTLELEIRDNLKGQKSSMVPLWNHKGTLESVEDY